MTAERVEELAGQEDYTPASYTITHADLAGKHFDPVTWAIEGLVPQGVTLLAAAPKIGKSWFALQAHQAKSAGAELWPGRDPERPADTLYIALEDNQRRLQKRALRSFPQRRMQDGTGWCARPLENLHFATQWPRANEGGLDLIDTWLMQHPGCELVTIDTLQRFWGSKSGKDSYAEDYEIGTLLKRIADDHNVGILLVHHTRKMEASDPLDMISGTQGLSGSVDAAMVLRRLRCQSDAELFVTGRDIENEEQLAVTFDRDECRWVSKGITVQEANLNEARQQVIAVIRRSEKPLTIKQVSAGLADDGISKKYDGLRKTVQRMVANGQLDKVEDNRYQVSHLSHLGSNPRGY